jgi:hypothetical protein
MPSFAHGKITLIVFTSALKAVFRLYPLASDTELEVTTSKGPTNRRLPMRIIAKPSHAQPARIDFNGNELLRRGRRSNNKKTASPTEVPTRHTIIRKLKKKPVTGRMRSDMAIFNTIVSGQAPLSSASSL